MTHGSAPILKFSSRQSKDWPLPRRRRQWKRKILATLAEMYDPSGETYSQPTRAAVRPRPVVSGPNLLLGGIYEAQGIHSPCNVWRGSGLAGIGTAGCVHESAQRTAQ